MAEDLTLYISEDALDYNIPDVYRSNSVIQLTLAEAVGKNTVCYIGTDGQLYIADNTDTTILDKRLCITLQAGAIGDTIQAKLFGTVKFDTALTAGSNYYLSTSGALTATVPTTGAVLLIGNAISNNILLLYENGKGGSVLNNFTATTAPTATDDSSAGYSIGSRWVDTTVKVAYTCVDATVGAAVWYQGGGGSGDMTKAVYDTNNNGIVDNAEKVGGYLPSSTVAAGVIPVTDSSGTLDAWVTSSGGGILNNFTATTAPTVTDDSNAGYAVGSRWIDTTADIAYECVDATAGAAIWQVIPTNTDQVTEGTTNLYYTDTRVSANADVTANTANRHTQNTDTGTSATEFYVDTTGANVPVKAHIQSTSNPHSVTASQVGINSTDDITEGTINLYDRDHFAGKTQDDLPDGTVYKQYNPANVAITGGSITGTTTPINAQTGTAYTLVLSDSGKIVTMNNASANTVTVPASTTTAFPVGTKIMITQTGAGSTTIAAATGVTIDNPTSASLAINEQYGSRVVVNLGTDLWLVV